MCWDHSTDTKDIAALIWQTHRTPISAKRCGTLIALEAVQPLHHAFHSPDPSDWIIIWFAQGCSASRTAKLSSWESILNKQILSASEIQQAINQDLEKAGLGSSYRVGVPVRLSPGTPDGHNWHFMDLLSGDSKAIETVTGILSDARNRYALPEE